MEGSDTGEVSAAVADRLSALDVSFLYVEGPTTPMHVGGVAVFSRPRGGFGYEDLLRLVRQRIALVPRYRQKVVGVPGHLGYPIWADDPDFDLRYHVRQSALPDPGSQEQLVELVARLMSRRLDRDRPLWEMYCVEGLSGGRFALVSKTHHAMVDGIAAVDLAQVLLDPVPGPVEEDGLDDWSPRPVPGAARRVRDAAAEIVARPSSAADTVRMATHDVRSTAGRVVRVVGGLAATARLAALPAPDTPLNVQIGAQRRFALARTDLDDYRRVRKQYGGTVNDVVLAAVAGAVRGFLLGRGEPVDSSTVIRALVPVSVRARADREQGNGARSGGSAMDGNQVLPHVVDLPVGEPNPVVRLSRIGYAMRVHGSAQQTVGARALIRLSGFAPPTMHALGARAAGSLARRFFNLVVTNVPGPQLPLYAGDARLHEVFPVVPLAPGQALAIGLTSYNGAIYYGLNADREALGDVEVIGGMIEESLAELVGTLR